MARNSTVDEAKLLPFAAWLMKNIQHRGCTIQQVADHAEMHVSQLHKIIKSYNPNYSQYQRPGYEKTVLIGEMFGDVGGALVSARYARPKEEIRYDTDPDVQVLIRNYQGSSPSARKHIVDTSALALEASRAGAFGRRTE